MNLNENIISINEDIISKSHLGRVEMRLNEMVNYVNLCWIKMWAMTFWYCDEQEKRYRFQELVKIIGKLLNLLVSTYHYLTYNINVQ